MANGLNIVNACHAAGFRPDTVNIMAMDYGSANDNGGNMLLSAQQAAQATRNQTGDIIGITPMIGVNDVATEIFTTSNASALVTWARGQSYINRLAFWSMLARQRQMRGTDVRVPHCSGVSQSTVAVRVDLQGLLDEVPSLSPARAGDRDAFAPPPANGGGHTADKRETLRRYCFATSPAERRSP